MDPLTLPVRSDDLDRNGHVRGPAYLTYADHARWVSLTRAGIDVDALRARGFGPVNLETTIRHLQELRAHDTVTIVSTNEWGTGKTSRITQELRRGDGVLVAEVASVGGILDLTTRRLAVNPGEYWRAHATDPDVLGL